MDWTSRIELDRVCRQLVDEAQDAVIVADREGVIRLWNRGAERIFGRSAAEAVGGSMDFIIPEKLRARHWEGYFRTMATGTTRYGADTLNVPALTAGGARISIEFTIVMLRDGEGKPEGVAAITRDVTARREKELDLRRRLAELEKAATA
jgi:PAS domain S-box-containing protein